MKIKHNLAIQPDGVTIKGQILETIFEEWEETGDRKSHYSKDWNFYIHSCGYPQLYESCLFVHGTNTSLDENIVSNTYDSPQEAQKIMNYINEFTVQEDEFTRWEEVEVRNECSDLWYKKIYLTTIDWAAEPYITVWTASEESFIKWEKFYPISWKYIRKLQPATITIKTEDGQSLAITKEKAKELGFIILNK